MRTLVGSGIEQPDQSLFRSYCDGYATKW